MYFPYAARVIACFVDLQTVFSPPKFVSTIVEKNTRGLAKFKKIDKEYLLTDDSVNCYGFRLLTSGYLIDEYKKNPIGYHMHDRPLGVVVRWEDLRVDGDKVYGKPVINLSHPRAQQTIDEIENGFLNAASVGHIVVLEYSTDENEYIPNQTGPTVKKWYNRECSLVDIPGNYNALSQSALDLFDENGNAINLADFTKPKPKPKEEMKQLFLTAAMLSALNLTAESNEEAANKAFSDLLDKAKKVDDLEATIQNLKADAEAVKANTAKEKVTALLAKALDENRITKELSAKLGADYSVNPEGLEMILSAMPVYVPLKEKLKAEGTAEEIFTKSWDEIYEAGKAEDLKAKDPELFKAKFKEKFGVDPK